MNDQNGTTWLQTKGRKFAALVAGLAMIAGVAGGVAQTTDFETAVDVPAAVEVETVITAEIDGETEQDAPVIKARRRSRTNKSTNLVLTNRAFSSTWS